MLLWSFLNVINVPMKKKTIPPAHSEVSAITLPRAVFGLVLVGIVIFSLTAVIIVLDRVRAFQDAALESAVTLRTDGARLAFARALEKDWQHLRRIADDLAELDSDEIRAVLNAVASTDERISWAGFASPDGTVIAASDGLLQGASVSERPWFRRGLQSPFVGVVHDALLLAGSVPERPYEPVRLLDMAVPVAGDDGKIVGVIGFHINAEWAAEFLTEFAQNSEIDLVLVNPQEEVLISTNQEMPEVPDLRSMRAAAFGMEVAERETWPDGTTYFTVVLPAVTYGELPSLGWSLIGRREIKSFSLTTGAELVRVAVSGLLVAGGLHLLLSFMFVRIFLMPLSGLIETAGRMATGQEEYPAETRTSAEAQRLSAALVRLGLEARRT